jgi:tripartite-type tricarboxylate transporter receptor subunit TctC
MFRAKMPRIGNILLLAGLVILPAPGQSQEYPTREINSIVNFPPGSGMDIMIRYYSKKLSDLAGVPVIVVNKPGANGNIATEYVARSKPDGHTIYINPASSTLAAASALYKKLPFDPVKDLQPVLLLTKLGFVIAVDAKSPVRSISDLTARLREKPGHGAYGTTANTGVVSAEMYKVRANLQTTQVDYKGTTELINDLYGGHLDFISLAPTALAEPIRTGKMRGLAVTSTTRLRFFPDIPTMAEAGFPGFDMTPWIGLVVPAGTPQPIVDKLAAWHRQINATEEAKQMLLQFGMDPLDGDTAAMAALLKSDIEKWAEYVKLAKIQAQ